MSGEVGRLFARKVELLRELADAEAALARVFESAAVSESPDTVMSLPEAAQLMGEPIGTFRRRLEYQKALVSRPTERRRRHFRAALDQIKRERLGMVRP